MVGFENISDKNFKGLVESVANQLNEMMLKDLCPPQCMRFLHAYNRFQEDERDGADYIYNPDSNEDMVSLLNGGYSLREIADVIGSSQLSSFKYLWIDSQRELRTMEWSGVVTSISEHMKDIVTCVFLYREYEEYKELFDFEIFHLIVKL